MRTGILAAVAASLLLGCGESEVPAPADVTDGEPLVQDSLTVGGIAWYDGSIEQAFATARASGKPVFLYWGAEWCPPCHELKATIFQQEQFIAQSRLFVPVYLDGDTGRAQRYGEQFGVMGYPTVIIFNPAGEEITRIPGGLDLKQYLGVLELALNALRPIRELLAAVQAGESIGDADWALLASYSWWQDRGRALGDQDRHQALRTLALACPERLADNRRKLEMLALRGWLVSEEPDAGLADDYRARLDAVLADARASRHNLALFVGHGEAIIRQLARSGEETDLRDRLLAPLLAASQDPAVNVLTRIDALYGWVQANRAVLAADEQLSQQQLDWLRERVEDNKAQLNSFQRHAALNSIWQIYYHAGLEEHARAALHEGIEVSKQPYYFMADLGYLERKLGNDEQSLAWYRKAWDHAQGPATRVQWGSNYLMVLLALSPDQLYEIATTGSAVLEELARQPDGLAQRNTARLGRIGASLQQWLEPEEGATSSAQQRAVVANELRLRLDQLCTDAVAGTEAAAMCENFMQPEPEQS